METIAIKITIPEEESIYMERLFYEYNASLNIIKFLMSQEEVLDKHLQKYLDSSEVKYTEMEMAKNELSNKYKPEGIGEYNYQFLFDESAIEYTFFQHKEM